jgi:hypothetical protein
MKIPHGGIGSEKVKTKTRCWQLRDRHAPIGEAVKNASPGEHQTYRKKAENGYFGVVPFRVSFIIAVCRFDCRKQTGRRETLLGWAGTSGQSVISSIHSSCAYKTVCLESHWTRQRRSHLLLPTAVPTATAADVQYTGSSTNRDPFSRLRGCCPLQHCIYSLINAVLCKSGVFITAVR